jgi:thioredoxin 1
MSTPESTGKPIHVESEDHLQELLADHPIALVDFHAEWCGPCKMLEPTVEEIAAETDAAVLKIDIDELQGVARDAGVRSVPTLAFYRNGEEAERVVGVQDKSNLVGIIDQLAA